jgi:hypothetical protein
LAKYSSKVNYSYLDKPFSLSWSPLEKESKSWRINVKKQGKQQWKPFQSKKPNYLFKKGFSGKYTVYIDEFLENETLISSPTTASLNVVYSETLPPPVSFSQTKEVNSNKDGSGAINYTPAEIDFGYQMSLTNSMNEVVYNNVSKKPSIKFTDMLPGSYEFKIATLNSKNVPGEVEILKILVPDTNALKKPVIKGIEVGD